MIKVKPISHTLAGTGLQSLISISLILLTAALGLVWVQPTAAHPPQQEGEQPVFTGGVQTSGDGSAAIQLQEAQLEAAYFATNGQLEGLEATPGGLALAPEINEGSYTSGAILSPLALTTDIVPLWGADLPEGTALRLETRLSYDGGSSWSDWVENPAAYYPVRDNLYSGNLIWADAGQVALQFKITLRRDWPDQMPLLRRVTLVFSDTSQGPTDGDIAGQMAMAAAENDQVCPVDKPAVVARPQWGCPGNPRFSHPAPPQYAPVTHIVIHQSETPNQPGPYQDYAGWVRSIWNFHANILWWGDVGYNYLIDPSGVIYEGRAGGDEVIGFHDGLNVGSMGLGFIGCYGNCDDPRLTVADPSEAMLESAANLIAWQVNQRGLDPLGSGPYNGLANISTIAGGRDVTDTTSPGDNIYNRLPQLRERVAQIINNCRACQINEVIFTQPSYNVNEPISYTVRLADYLGAPLTGATVTLDNIAGPGAFIQANTSFGFVDRAGDYEGGYPGLALPGVYTFTFSAVDPTGIHFAPCSAAVTLPITGDAPPTDTPTSTATPTPTPTATPTGTPPTDTPTPTSTPTATPTSTPPTGPVLRLNPSNLALSVCTAQGTTAVVVDNVTNMVGVQFELTYNPVVVQVIDADLGRDGVQIRAGSAFTGGFVAQNTVDVTNGRIAFAVTLLGGSTINGNAQVAVIDWQPQNAGSTALTLEDVILANNAGQPIAATVQSGQADVAATCANVSGSVALQGRNDYSGVTIAGAGQQTQTQADGVFSLTGAGQLDISFPGYLPAQVDVPARIAQQSSDFGAQSVNLGVITLLAGDVNADNFINILDLAYMARLYGLADPLADLNGDGTVNIVDLALAASNYGRQGPLTEW